MKVSKDGGVTFHEIVEDFDDQGNDRSLQAAQKKGYKPYVDVTKDGKQTFTIEASSASLAAAQKKGYQLAQTVEDYAKPTDAKIGALEAAGRKFSDFATLGNADEIAAGVSAAGSALNKGSMRDVATDYRSSRDAEREAGEQAWEQQKTASVLGGAAAIVPQLLTGGAGIATTAGKQGLSAAMRTAAVEGAAWGAGGAVGASDADLTRGDVAGLRNDVIEGAGLGMVAGAGGAAVAKGVGAGITAVKNRGALASGMKEGAQEVQELGIPFVDAGRKLAGAMKGGSRALQETAETRADLAALRPERAINDGGRAIRPFPGDGMQQAASGKILDSAGRTVSSSEDEILGIAALGGKSRTNEYIAAKAASGQPGQIDAAQYQRILEMPHERRMAAREFNAKSAAAELAPLVDELGGEFNRARSTGYGRAQAQAMQRIDAASTERVLPALYDTMEKSTRSKLIQGRTRAALEDVNNLLTRGDSAAYEVAPGDWRKIAPAERFKRMQYARQLLDGEIDWNKENKIGIGEQLLRKMRDELDASLKSAPMKSEGDAFFGAGKDVEAGLFDATEFRQANGKYDVDEFKLAKLFGDNDAAGRFGKAIEKAREYVKDPKFNAESRVKIEALLEKLDKTRATAGDARDLMSMRMKNGPSSPAIERLGSQLSKEGIPAAAINNPAGYVNSLDQFARTYAEPVFGKRATELSQQEKVKLVRAFTWQQSNPKATQAETQAVFGQIFKP